MAAGAAALAATATAAALSGGEAAGQDLGYTCIAAAEREGCSWVLAGAGGGRLRWLDPERGALGADVLLARQAPLQVLSPLKCLLDRFQRRYAQERACLASAAR